MTEKKTLTRSEAFKALAEGKKVFREGSKDGFYLQMDCKGLVIDSRGFEANWNAYGENGWQLYEEPHQNPTLQECLAATRVKVEWPEHVNAHYPKSVFTQGLGWEHTTICILTTALSFPGAVVRILDTKKSQQLDEAKLTFLEG